MGPTASGKTELAVRLVRELPCDIVSVDSVMVYRGMDIGSAKPDAATLAAAPHRLIDICDPAEAFSAAQFRARALAEIAAIQARGRIPLLVGGTFLYFKALEQGLSPLPAADPSLRARLEAQAQAEGWAALHARLVAVDPVAAARIHANDPQRIQRALEVYELTGRPLSAWFEQAGQHAPPFHILKLIMEPSSREHLRDLIAQRFQAMLAQGLVAEVGALFARPDLHADLPALRAVGYRQVWAYLTGQYDYDTLVARAITATRQFAKRQATWLRGEQGGARFEARRPEVLEQVLKYLARHAIS
jgi:tRNA dimethylallyltransferase